MARLSEPSGSEDGPLFFVSHLEPPRKGHMEQDPSAPASAAETPAADGMSVSSGPFPWETAGFGQKTTTTVSAPDAPRSDSAQPATAVASNAVEDAPKDTPAEGAPATEPSKPTTDPAETPAPPETPEQQTSRRAAARERDEAEKAELRAEVDRIIAERDEARATADKAKADAAALKANRNAAMAKRTELIGPEDEYQRRTRIANRMFDPNYDGPTLTNEQASELAKWTATRELQEPFEIAANQTAAAWVDQEINGQRAVWARQALAVADEIGLPREALREPDLGVLLKATDANTAARIRAAEVKPLQEQNSQYEATIRDLETKLAHSARTPVIGGRSDGGLVGGGNGWDPSLHWDANFTREAAKSPS